MMISAPFTKSFSKVFARLPDDLVQRTFSFLGGQEIARIARVSRQFKKSLGPSLIRQAQALGCEEKDFEGAKRYFQTFLQKVKALAKKYPNFKTCLVYQKISFLKHFLDFQATVQKVHAELKTSVKLKEELTGALCHSSQKGEIICVKLLLQLKADPDAEKEGDYPLHLAAQKGHADVVTYLLKQGARIEKRDREGYTALCLAVNSAVASDRREAKVKDTVQRLLAAKAECTVSTFEEGVQTTPLHLAVINGFPSVVALLLQQKGVTVGALDSERNTPLNKLVGGREIKESEKVARVMKVLLDAKANPNTPDCHGAPPLHWAAYRGDDESVKLLLEAKASINARDAKGWTALARAVSQGRENTVVTLLLHRADPTLQNWAGKTPLKMTNCRPIILLLDFVIQDLALKKSRQEVISK